MPYVNFGTKDELRLELFNGADILAALGRRCARPVLVAASHWLADSARGAAHLAPRYRHWFGRTQEGRVAGPARHGTNVSGLGGTGLSCACTLGPTAVSQYAT
jgi:hypothetical protein